MTSSSSKGQLTERQQALLAVARFLVERNKRRVKAQKQRGKAQ
jgi:hypothetical protein